MTVVCDGPTSFFAFEPGAPDVLAASATGIYVTALVNLLHRHSHQLQVKLRWLRPAEARIRGTRPQARSCVAVGCRDERMDRGNRARPLSMPRRALVVSFFYPPGPPTPPEGYPPVDARSQSKNCKHS